MFCFDIIIDLTPTVICEHIIQLNINTTLCMSSKTCPAFIHLHFVALIPFRSQNVTTVCVWNRLSKYLIISCLSLLNDDSIVMPIRKRPQMWCWSISIDRQIIVVVLSCRHCPDPMHEGLNWEWMWLDFQSPSLNSHAGNTNSSI